MRRKGRRRFLEGFACCRSPRVVAIRAELKETNGTHGLPNYVPLGNVRADVYRLSRSLAVDEDEKLNWNEEAVQWLMHSQRTTPVNATLRNQIRHGVPDYLKRVVWERAQTVTAFMAAKPEYYKRRVHDVFGGVVPSQLHSRVPTFTGGFLGLEEKIVGTPVNLNRVEGSIMNDEEVIIGHGVSWTRIDQDSLQFTSGQHSFSITPLPADLSKGSESPCKTNAPIAQPPPPFPLLSLQSGMNGFSYEDYRERDSTPLARRRSTKTVKNKKNTPLKPALIRSPSGSQSPPQVSVDALQKKDYSFMAAGGATKMRPLKTRRSQSVGKAYEDDCSDGSLSIIGTKSQGHFDRKRGELESMLHRDPDEVHTLEKVTHLHHLLTPEGFVAAKRVLWLLNDTCHDLEFNPLVPPLLCVALLYIDEERAFILLMRLVEAARRTLNHKDQRIFLTLSRSDFIRFVKLVRAAAEKHLPRVVGRLELLGVDVSAWIARSLSDGLATTVSFNVLIRIYTTFVFEGARVLQRYVLAILKLGESTICGPETSSNVALAALDRFHDCSDPAEINILTKAAFRFSFSHKHRSITSYDSLELPTPYLMSVRVQRLYRPRVGGKSGIMEEGDWEFLWSCLPTSLRLCDPQLRFCSNKDGATVTALWRKMPADLLPTILVIREQESGRAIGVFANQCFGRDGSESFVFTLRPKPMAYFWTGVTTTFTNILQDTAVSVGVNDAAIWFDWDLLHGRTAPSVSYDSPALLDGGDSAVDFIVSSLEVWTLE